MFSTYKSPSGPRAALPSLIEPFLSIHNRFLVAKHSLLKTVIKNLKHNSPSSLDCRVQSFASSWLRSKSCHQLYLLVQRWDSPDKSAMSDNSTTLDSMWKPSDPRSDYRALTGSVTSWLGLTFLAELDHAVPVDSMHHKSILLGKQAYGSQYL